MVSLLDVNVLVALVVPEHEHHEAALAWYAGETFGKKSAHEHARPAAGRPRSANEGRGQ